MVLFDLNCWSMIPCLWYLHGEFDTDWQHEPEVPFSTSFYVILLKVVVNLIGLWLTEANKIGPRWEPVPRKHSTVATSGICGMLLLPLFVD